MTRLEIRNDKRLSWDYVSKLTANVSHEDSLNIDIPLSISDIVKMHFITSKILEDYYAGTKK